MGGVEVMVIEGVCRRISSLPLLLRIGAFLVGLVLVWLPPALGIWLLWPELEVLLGITLYLWLLIWLWLWGRRVRQDLQPFTRYGLLRTPMFYWELGISCLWGGAGLLLCFGIEASLGWLEWQPVQGSPVVLTLCTGLGLGLGVALVEELVFRGWLVDELGADLGAQAQVGSWSSLIFALAHFIKPWQQILRTWPQFPGLFLLGWILWRARCFTLGQLGVAMGLHAGWVWGITVVNSLNWVRYTDAVPAWITGLDNNPLAGLIGILFLLVNGAALEIYRCLSTSPKRLREERHP